MKIAQCMKNAVFNSDPSACHDVIFQCINTKFTQCNNYWLILNKQVADVNTRKKYILNFSFISHVSVSDMREKSSALKCDRSFQYGGVSVLYVRECSTATLIVTTSQ